MSKSDDAFSRGPEVALFGKCDSEVKTKVDEDTKALFEMAARKAGFVYPAEFLRNVVYILAYGEEEVKRRTNDRLNNLINLGLDKAPQKDGAVMAVKQASRDAYQLTTECNADAQSRKVILDFLENGQADDYTRGEIAMGLNMPINRVTPRVNELVKSGDITELPRRKSAISLVACHALRIADAES